MKKEAHAEIDVKNKKTGSTRSFRVYSVKNAAILRVGMRLGLEEFVDAVWPYPDSLGRDYK
ncbi:hypothetical protein LCGC14_2613160 [marine sediment metagenome]|uniref:Uncharacterized protein n=1 Tax=marine sediment metagenome TaxID=412755 RepID=A0A0F9A5B6_9ZZZZ